MWSIHSIKKRYEDISGAQVSSSNELQWRVRELLYSTHWSSLPTVFPHLNANTIQMAYPFPECVCVQCVKINWACLHCRGSAPSLHSHSTSPPLSLAPTVKANSDCLRSETRAIQLLFLGMGGWKARASHFPQPMTREGGAGNRCIRGVRISTHAKVCVAHARTHPGHHH